MWTLPPNKRITLRDKLVDKPLRNVVVRLDDRWQGDRVSVEIVNAVHITMQEGGVDGMPRRVHTKTFSLALTTGMPDSLPGRSDREGGFWFGVAGLVEPGHAVVSFRQPSYWRASERMSDVVFYLNAFSADERDVEMLGVARDAVLELDDHRAHQIARQVLPQTYGLFLALVKKERNMLRGADST